MSMYRYIVLMWSRTDCETAQAAKFIATKLHELSPHAWSQAWDNAGLAIYHSGEHKGRMQTYRLHGGRGAVLGRLFRNDYSSVIDDFDAFESRRFLETRGQRLIDHYWGRYVAFLSDPASGTRYVMRDPTGAFPCFYTVYRGVTIHFSDMQDAAHLDFLPFTVNWEYLKVNIVLPQFQTTITGLNEVAEILPAECVEITAFERRSRFVWNPTEISQMDVVEHPEEAAKLLRHTVKSTIGALAGCYDRIIHNLGGLDSSIVLACIAQAEKRPEVTCINFCTKSPSCEERFFSRQVAKKFNVELVEVKLDYRKADLNKLFYSNQMACPLGFFDCLGLTGDLRRLAKDQAAQALLYGVGGDQVFYQPPLNLAALDFVRQKGLLRKTILRVAMEASRYGQKSLPLTARQMLRERFLPAPCYEYVRDARFGSFRTPLVSPDFTSIGGGHEKYLHPLLMPKERDLKGKYMHILMSALRSYQHYDHLDSDYSAPPVYAYLAQPIITACLQIPSWVLIHGGIDRGLARMAFQDDLPRDIVRRVSKSTPTEYYDDIFAHNKDLLREVLLDGVLVREGVLLHDKVEKALTGQDHFLGIQSHEILGYLSTEVWLRRWAARPSKNSTISEAAL